MRSKPILLIPVTLILAAAVDNKNSPEDIPHSPATQVRTTPNFLMRLLEKEDAEKRKLIDAKAVKESPIDRASNPIRFCKRAGKNAKKVESATWYRKEMMHTVAMPVYRLDPRGHAIISKSLSTLKSDVSVFGD
mmetsp:Transcript_1210/g.1709  ORF Transcript_1210/g.1709 Transcript_1210/m.1709 type:complete len:134 (+) Transcript_1210:392-793(+)